MRGSCFWSSWLRITACLLHSLMAIVVPAAAGPVMSSVTDFASAGMPLLQTVCYQHRVAASCLQPWPSIQLAYY